MNRLVRLAAIVALFALVTGLLHAQQKVTVGITAKSTEAGEKDFAGILKHLRASKALAFEVKFYPTYDETYKAFVDKKVDFALVGAVKYAQARYETGAVPVIAEGGLVRSMVVVPASSPIKVVKDLKGKRFGFGYKDSTSTHLMPLLLLSKHLVREKDLGQAAFLGSDQDKLVEKLLAGEVDATAVVESVYKRNAAKLRVIEKSEPFPGSPLIAQKTTPPATIHAVTNVFLSYKPSGVGTRFNDGAVKVDNNNFNQIRFLVKVLYGKSYV